MTNQMKMMIVGHEFRPWLRKRGHTIGWSVPRIATKQFQPKDRRSHLALMGEQTHGDLDQRQRARTLEPAQLTFLHEEWSDLPALAKMYSVNGACATPLPKFALPGRRRTRR